MTQKEALKILMLPEHADRTQIRRAYAEQSKIYHVETHPAEFARLHEAYKTALAQVSMPENRISAETVSRKDAASPSGSSVSQKLPPPYTDILDRLVDEKPPVSKFHELIQLMYYKCRYEEAAPEDADARRIGNAEIEDEANPFAHMTADRPEAVSDEQTFLQTPWSMWKMLDWTALICHPAFLKNQYSAPFLEELYDFLEQEAKEEPHGIGQNLYLSLCVAYGLFCEEPSPPDIPYFAGQAASVKQFLNCALECPQNALLEGIENILRFHPSHSEYLQDLQCWTSLKQAREIVLLCQRAFSFSKETGTAREQEAFAAEFLDAAEEKLLQEYAPWKDFIFDSLTLLPGALFSEKLPERKAEFQELLKIQKECFDDFAKALLDHRTEGNSLYEYNYRPLAGRIKAFREKYLSKRNWKKIICSPVFVSSFQNWMEPRRGGFVLQCALIEYELRKELCRWFAGASPLEKDTLSYLKTSFYFPEYEKWYRQECIWESQHIEERYFNEVFPIPALSPGKLELLRTAEQGTIVNVKNIQAVFNNLPGHNAKAFDFLTRVTNAMTHFKFLVITPKYEKDPVPGDAFCFMEDGVILYRKKENRTCRLSHQSFYDFISHQIELIALNAKYSKTGYTEEFIDTVCKNMYYYHCFISRLPEK